MSITTIQAKLSNTDPIRPITLSSGLPESIEKVATIARNYFKRKAEYILPILTKLIRSELIAKAIINGAFFGFVQAFFFACLGLPKNNFGLNLIAGYLFVENCRLFDTSEYIIQERNGNFNQNSIKNI